MICNIARALDIFLAEFSKEDSFTNESRRGTDESYSSSYLINVWIFLSLFRFLQEPFLTHQVMLRGFQLRSMTMISLLLKKKKGSVYFKSSELTGKTPPIFLLVLIRAWILLFFSSSFISCVNFLDFILILKKKKLFSSWSTLSRATVRYRFV